MDHCISIIVFNYVLKILCFSPDVLPLGGEGYREDGGGGECDHRHSKLCRLVVWQEFQSHLAIFED